jgi:membrane-bound lytic murein transglycosylase D
MNIRIIALVFLCVGLPALFIMESITFSGNLFSNFQDRTYSEQGLRRALDNYPREPLFALPIQRERPFFTAVNDLSICRHREVRKFMYQYLTRDREYVKSSILRSRKYLDMIHDIIDENGELPSGLALLPLLESGFDPRAVSRSRAVGLWQFIRGTSAIFGLKTDVWLDERRNVEKSTRAAVLHLHNLYRRFSSWELALAAYNGGSGHIIRAMKETGARTFWELHEKGALRRETAEYVPRFAALLVIYANMDNLNLKEEIPDYSPTNIEKMPLPGSASIERISRLSGTSMRTIRYHNPELNSGITPPYYGTYHLKVPSHTRISLMRKTAELSISRMRWDNLTEHLHTMPLYSLESLTGRI